MPQSATKERDERRLLLTRRSSMTRVLSTSSGVVSAAATPPAKLPQTAASYACRGLWSASASRIFSSSYSGNCNEVKGIYRQLNARTQSQDGGVLTSLMIVEPKPR